MRNYRLLKLLKCGAYLNVRKARSAEAVYTLVTPNFHKRPHEMGINIKI